MTLYVTDTLDVTALVENTGTVAGQQDIVLDADGSEVSRRSDLVVGPQDTESVTLEWDTGGAAAGQQGLVVRSDDSSVSQTVDLQAAGSISIDSVVPSNPDPDEQTTVATTLENVSDERRVYTLKLVVDGTVEDELPVVLGSGQSASGPTLSWTPSSTGTKTVEVRSGLGVASDSTTVTVGDATTVPSSAIHRWKLDDVGTGTATDSIGSADGTVNGVSNVSGTYQGGSAADGDGTDDDIIIASSGEPTDWTGNRLAPFSFAFTIDSFANAVDFPRVFSIVGSSGENQIEVAFGIPNDGDIFLQVVQGGDDYSVSVENPGLANSGKHRVVMGMDASSGTAKAYIDNAQETITTNSTALLPTGTGSSAINADSFFYVRDFAPSITRMDAILDDVIVYDTLVDATLADDDYKAQPWS